MYKKDVGMVSGWRKQRQNSISVETKNERLVASAWRNDFCELLGKGKLCGLDFQHQISLEMSNSDSLGIMVGPQAIT